MFLISVTVLVATKKKKTFYNSKIGTFVNVVQKRNLTEMLQFSYPSIFSCSTVQTENTASVNVLLLLQAGLASIDLDNVIA